MNDIGREQTPRIAQKLVGIRAAQKFSRERKNIFTDSLTGLHNRAWFEDDLQRKTTEQARTGRPLWVFLFDIDNFKQFNTAFGYREGGDTVLRLMSKFPRREEERICRIGGEEFAQLVNEDVHDMDIEKIAARYLNHMRVIGKELLQKMNPLAGHEEEAKKINDITISIGIAKLQPEEDPEKFLKRANLALDRAKKTGKNKAVVANMRDNEISYEDIVEKLAA